MRLEKLMQGMETTPLATETVRQMEIVGLTCDSRQVRPGYLFAALPGSAVDGRDYIPQALKNGAKAVLAPPGATLGSALEQAYPDVPVIQDANPRRLFAQFAAHFFDGQPSHVSAITGTNGKTSVATFLRQIWTSLHKSAGSMGTLGVEAPGMKLAGTLTTPDSAALHEIMKRLSENEVTHLAMEASSHGLDQYRL
ncbi:MAG: Mur ligase family protein, partial [Alphaproteobacteria bacterium]|nr:Mur ligase family protein [Alphaproteobacteria bacterium]